MHDFSSWKLENNTESWFVYKIGISGHIPAVANLKSELIYITLLWFQANPTSFKWQ